jgi:hypothetical protein
MAATNDWITDRAPTEDDSCEEAGHCVEATYKNGIIGWEIAGGDSWDEDEEIVAWRKIRPAYKENRVNKPTCEDIWNNEGVTKNEVNATHSRYGRFNSDVYRRVADDTFWRVEYHESDDDVVNELRDGEANISRVIPEEVTETVYNPFCEYQYDDT